MSMCHSLRVNDGQCMNGIVCQIVCVSTKYLKKYKKKVTTTVTSVADVSVLVIFNERL